MSNYLPPLPGWEEMRWPKVVPYHPIAAVQVMPPLLPEVEEHPLRENRAQPYGIVPCFNCKGRNFVVWLERATQNHAVVCTDCGGMLVVTAEILSWAVTRPPDYPTPEQWGPKWMRTYGQYIEYLPSLRNRLVALYNMKHGARQWLTE